MTRFVAQDTPRRDWSSTQFVRLGRITSKSSLLPDVIGSVNGEVT